MMGAQTVVDPVVLKNPAPEVPIIAVGDQSVGLRELRGAVADQRAGAIVTFEGVTRDVDALRFEAYTEMAARQLVDICTEACTNADALKVAVAHYVGDVPLGEPSVIVVASGAHRDQAFVACRYVIDTLKERAPIWKVELDGTERRTVPGIVPRPRS